MQDFLAGGHSYVLSLNHTEHVDMVKSSRYAYITDATSVQIESIGDCSLKLLPEYIMGQSGYRFALQKNSAYRDIMSEM